MSKVKIEGNASGTGTLTISAPNTNTDRSLTLPDGAGEILLSDGDGSNLTGISGGKVLQVVSSEYSTKETTASTSFIDSGFTVNITPTDATTKMLIFVSAYGGAQRTDQNIYTAKFRLKESTTTTTLPSATHGFGFGAHYDNDTAYARVGHHVTGSVYHDHNTTSQLTYTLQYAAFAYLGYLNTFDNSTTGVTSTITIMEIAQ